MSPFSLLYFTNSTDTAPFRSPFFALLSRHLLKSRLSFVHFHLTPLMSLSHWTEGASLSPHTTHVSQPLDRGCFAPLKAAWREVSHQYMAENPGKVVTRYTFSGLFCKAWMKAITMTNITSGFNVPGAYPVNRDAVHVPRSSGPQQSLPEATGLAYTPVYRPYPRNHFVITSFTSGWLKRTNATSCCVYRCTQKGVKGSSVRFSEAPNLRRL